MSSSWQSPDLFGRDYNLSVTLASGGSISISSAEMEPGALRFTFDVRMYLQQVLWWAEISIYNLNYETAKQLTFLQQGDTVVLQAGYKNGSHQMGTIFEGSVFQPLFRRENVVDFVLTLQCFAGNAQNFINTNYGRLVTHRDLVNMICKNAYSPIEVANVDESLSNVQLPRGGVLFGDPAKLLAEIGRQNNLATWIGPEGLNMVNLGKLVQPIEPLTSTHPAYAPPIPPGSNAKAKSTLDYSIIGTPQQTWEGVDFKVLLDPSLKVKYPPDVVQLDMSSTQLNLLPLPQPFGSGGQGFIPPPSPTGAYIVAGIRHFGDTRGDPWYTEICGVTQNGMALALGGNY